MTEETEPDPWIDEEEFARGKRIAQAEMEREQHDWSWSE